MGSLPRGVVVLGTFNEQKISSYFRCPTTTAYKEWPVCVRSTFRHSSYASQEPEFRGHHSHGARSYYLVVSWCHRLRWYDSTRKDSSDPLLEVRSAAGSKPVMGGSIYVCQAWYHAQRPTISFGSCRDSRWAFGDLQEGILMLAYLCRLG